jgi:hypothetical protein
MSNDESIKAINKVDKTQYELLSQEDMFGLAFQPKMTNQYLVKCENTNPDIKDIHPHMVYSIDRPKLFRGLVDNKIYWHPIKMKLYDPIAPSTSQAIYDIIKNNDGKLGDITINVLGPVGDLVEKWILKDCIINEADFGTLDWGYRTDDYLSETTTVSSNIMSNTSSRLKYYILKVYRFLLPSFNSTVKTVSNKTSGKSGSANVLTIELFVSYKEAILEF